MRDKLGQISLSLRPHDIVPVSQSARTRLVLFEADSDYTLITFSSMRPMRNRTRFWADTLSRKAGIRTLSFAAEEPHWFPPTEMGDLVDAARELVGDRPAIAYGFSMGGYAALKYSRRLRAAAALAFSPQYSIDPAVTDDPRFRDHFRDTLHQGMEIIADDLAPNCIVVADRAAQWDFAAAEKIRARDPRCVTMLPIVHSGHATISRMLETRVALDVFSALLGPWPEATQRIARILQARKKRSAVYFGTLAMLALKSGRRDLARRLCERGLEETQGQGLHTVIARIIADTDPQGALEYIRTNVPIHSPRTLRVMARAHRALGRIDDAQRLLKEASDRRMQR